MDLGLADRVSLVTGASRGLDVRDVTLQSLEDVADLYRTQFIDDVPA